MTKLVLAAATFAAITGMTSVASASDLAPWKCNLSASVSGTDTVFLIGRYTKLNGTGTVVCKRFTGRGPDGKAIFEVTPPRSIALQMEGGGLALGIVGSTVKRGCLQMKMNLNRPLTSMDRLDLAPESGFQGGRGQGSAGGAVAYSKGRIISNGTYVKAQCDLSQGASLNLIAGFGMQVRDLRSQRVNRVARQTTAPAAQVGPAVPPPPVATR